MAFILQVQKAGVTNNSHSNTDDNHYGALWQYVCPIGAGGDSGSTIRNKPKTNGKFSEYVQPVCHIGQSLAVLLPEI